MSAPVLDTTEKKGHAQFYQLLQIAADIHAAKNSDYADSDSDPLKNFKDCASFGVSPFEGCLVRLSDKFMRIKNLQNKRKRGEEAAVKDESIRDTLNDAGNYSLISAILLLEETKGAQFLTQPLREILSLLVRQSVDCFEAVEAYDIEHPAPAPLTMDEVLRIVATVEGPYPKPFTVVPQVPDNALTEWLQEANASDRWPETFKAEAPSPFTVVATPEGDMVLDSLGRGVGVIQPPGYIPEDPALQHGYVELPEDEAEVARRPAQDQRDEALSQALRYAFLRETSALGVGSTKGSVIFEAPSADGASGLKYVLSDPVELAPVAE